MTHALTPREEEVLALMAAGYTNREIGSKIHAAEETVKSHAKSIYYKLDARNRAHAVALAFELGIERVLR